MENNLKKFCNDTKFIDENPNTAIAITKALIRRKWLDEPSNCAKAAGILSKPVYVGADSVVIANL
jgi:nitrate/nitrite transport system substrate-binding protein